MASDSEKLFIVLKRNAKNALIDWSQFKVFRTRNAARVYAKNKNSRTNRFKYVVRVASWGPES